MKQITEFIETSNYRKSLAMLFAVLTAFFGYEFITHPSMNALGCIAISLSWAVVNANMGFRLYVPRWMLTMMWLVAFLGIVLSVTSHFS